MGAQEASDAGAAEWFYDDGAQPRGPFSLGAIGQLVAAGVVAAGVAVARDGDEGWRPYAEVAEPGNGGAGWFYHDGSEERGPVDLATLQQMLAAGMVTGGTLVRPAGEDSWRTLQNTMSGRAAATGGAKEGVRGTPGSVVRGVQEMMSVFSGLPHLDGFGLGMLFRGALDWRGGRGRIDERFNAGCRLTTPALCEVDAGWPVPWAFPRILLVGVAMTIGLAIAFHLFGNSKVLPGLMIAGSFAVPAACLAMFFEMNVPRNVSMTRVSYLVAAGGALSLLVSLVLYSALPLATTFLGAMAAGIIEEAGKLLAVVVLVGGAGRYGWTLNGILFGAAVGTGFAGFESAGYLFEACLGGCSAGDFYFLMVQRGLFSPFCHVVWTATVVGALWRAKGEGSPWGHLADRRFLRILAIVMGLHMLWNSPLHFMLGTGGYWGLRLVYASWVVSVVGSWYLALMLVQEGLNEVRMAQGMGAGRGGVAGRSVRMPATRAEEAVA